MEVCGAGDGRRFVTDFCRGREAAFQRCDEQLLQSNAGGGGVEARFFEEFLGKFDCDAHMGLVWPIHGCGRLFETKQHETEQCSGSVAGEVLFYWGFFWFSTCIGG